MSTSGMHFVAPDSDTAWCAEGEMMVSALCLNSSSTSPVTAYPNGAKCAYGDNGPARARIMCMPASGQQGMAAPGGGSMMASLGIHLVSSEGALEGAQVRGRLEGGGGDALQNLRDRSGDTRADWGGGRDGRYAALVTAAQAAWSRCVSHAFRETEADCLMTVPYRPAAAETPERR